MKKVHVGLLLFLGLMGACGAVMAISAEMFVSGPSGEFIDETEVLSIVQSELQGVAFENVSCELTEDPLYGTIRECSVRTEYGKNLVLGIDAGTGEVKYFIGKARESAGVSKQIDIEDAKQIAADYIRKQNVDGPMQFYAATYIEPHAEGDAGTYHIRYDRVIDGIVCLSDGVSIFVNAETGEITNYFRKWNFPGLILVSSKPKVSETEAGEVLRTFMNETFESSDLRVISAELRWADAAILAGNHEGPQDIRLIWWIKFEDDYTRSHDAPSPALAWIDAGTGDVLKYSYLIG